MITKNTISYKLQKKNQIKFEILFLNRLKNIYHKGSYLKSMAQPDT